MSDDALIDDLRRALPADPVPDAVAGAARAAFGWRTIDDELAELLADSADTVLAGVRGRGDRRLSFEAARLVIEFVLVPGPRGSRLEGQLAPPGAAAVEVRHSGGAIEVQADEHGRFALDAVPHGPLSLRVLRDGEGPVRTPATGV